MSLVDFPVFDADNHYYEAVDAFTRHLDPAMAKRTMQWADVNGKQRLLVAGSVNRFIPNPTFANVSKPGALVDYFRAKAGISDLRAAFGELEPIEERPEYRNREARLRVMDEQGLEATIMLPTLGVGMEKALEHDPLALMAAFTAFNRWLLDDWGFGADGRIYGAPYITLTDVDWAISELDHAVANGAGAILMRPGSVLTPSGRRSPGDPSHTPFWERLNETGISLVIHGGDSSYQDYQAIWGLGGEAEAFRTTPLNRLLSASPIRDTIASLISDQLFEKFPNLRVATIETGAEWVAPLVKKLKAVAIQMPGAFTVDPYEQFMNHVWVSPFFEDDVHELIAQVGVERVVFGSDWPHAEGLAEPTAFIKEVDGLSDSDVRKVMHDNARFLVTPQTA